jgi:hypothetical protein
MVGCLGSELRLAPSQRQIMTGALVRPPRLGRGVLAVPRLNKLYPGISLTTEGHHGKPQSG